MAKVGNRGLVGVESPVTLARGTGLVLVDVVEHEDGGCDHKAADRADENAVASNIARSGSAMSGTE